MNADYEIVHVIDVAFSKLGNHKILTYYNESNPLGAVGAVFSGDMPYGGVSNVCLGANCQLNAMWTSNEGHLWVVDDHGDVFTNADVHFTSSPYKHLEFSSGDFDIDWNVGEVFQGQLNGIWGTSDSDVWVTSFSGPALHWDGESWTQYELPQAPNQIDGSASDDVYIVGYHGNIHHWDGSRWTKVNLPEGILSTDTFTDVKAVNKELVYITGRSGCLLVGNAKDGFRDIGSPKFAWYGVGSLDGRIFLAGGELGIFELVDEQFLCLKDKGNPVGVFETPEAINFIPAEQQPSSWYVRYSPNEDRAWTKISS
ncbi:hypothetical protein [Litoribacillus peritrichatus]|uniref:Uncharacterized protein n=1 Tax=Litoribacillus peritrichatus TaxID=718191 RepID=A0ABP7MRW6_9GAMM